MFNNNKILVVIPARGGSKGIPRKNIRLLNHKPLISYAINSPNITLDKNGKITAVSVGETTVTVNTYNGKSAECHVIIEKAPETLVTDKSYIILPVGKNTRLSSCTPDYNGNANITYTSTNNAVATVDENGNIFGNAFGIAKITAQTYNGKTADCIVHIKELPSDITMLAEEKFDVSLQVLTSSS